MRAQNADSKTPTEAESLLAKETLRRISEMHGRYKSDLRIHIQCENDEQSGEDITLPMSAFRLLKEILEEMAQGHAVTLLPVKAELSTQQAADLLNVSRPFLIGLLEEGELPFRLVGKHRRVLVDDLMSYIRKDDDSRRRAADDLSADAQELALGNS